MFLRTEARYLLTMATSLAFLGVLRALTIDSQLTVIKNDCYERLAIGQRLSPKDVYKTSNANTVLDCQLACTQEKELCKSFSFGIGVKGNATCELSVDLVKETADLKPIGTKADSEFDLYIKKVGCTLIIDPNDPAFNTHRPPPAQEKPPSKPPPSESYDKPPPSGGYGKPPPSGGYEKPPPSGGYDKPSPSGGYEKPPPSGGYDKPPPSGGYDKPPPPPSYGPPPADGYGPSTTKPAHNKPQYDGVEHVQTLVSISTGPQKPVLHPVHEILVGDGPYNYAKPPFRPPALNHPYDRPVYKPRPDYYGSRFEYLPRPDYDSRPNLDRYDSKPGSSYFVPYGPRPLPEKYGSYIPRPEDYYNRPKPDDYYKPRPDKDYYKPRPSDDYSHRPNPFGDYMQRPSGGYRPSDDYGNRPNPPSDYPHRPPRPSDDYGDRPNPQNDYPHRPSRPSDGYGDRPNRPNDYNHRPLKPSDDYGDRPNPPSDYPHRPQRPNNDYGDRPNPPNDYPHRPSRPSDDYGDRPNPPSDYNHRPLKPSDDYGNRPNPPNDYFHRPSKPNGGYGDRPNSPSDYPQRPSRPSDDYGDRPNPSSDYNHRPLKPSDDYGNRPNPPSDYNHRPLRPSDDYGNRPNAPSDYNRPKPPSADYNRPNRPSDDYDHRPKPPGNIYIHRPSSSNDYNERPKPPSDSYGSRPNPPSDEYGQKVKPKPSSDYGGKPSKPTNEYLFNEEVDRYDRGPSKPDDGYSKPGSIKPSNPDNPNGGGYGNSIDGGSKPKEPHSKPIVTQSVGPHGETITSIITELDEACFRRVLAGKRVTRALVKRALFCERVEDCQRECADEKRFVCEGFNYRLDPTGRGKGECELLDIPLSHLDIGRDLYPDPDYDYYERDRNAASVNCKGHGYYPQRPPQEWGHRRPRPDYYDEYDDGYRPGGNRRGDFAYHSHHSDHSYHHHTDHGPPYDSYEPYLPPNRRPYEDKYHDDRDKDKNYWFNKPSWGSYGGSYGTSYDPNDFDRKNYYLPPKVGGTKDWGQYGGSYGNGGVDLHYNGYGVSHFDIWGFNKFEEKFHNYGELPPYKDYPPDRPPNGGSYLPAHGGYSPEPPKRPIGGYLPEPPKPPHGDYLPEPPKRPIGGYLPEPPKPPHGGYLPEPPKRPIGGYLPEPPKPPHGGYLPEPPKRPIGGYLPEPPKPPHGGYLPEPPKRPIGGSYLPDDFRPPIKPGYLPDRRPPGESYLPVPERPDDYYHNSVLPAEPRYPYHYDYLKDECSLRSATGFKLHKGIVKKFFAVPSIYECELLCFKEKDFPCASYAFRYTVSLTSPTDNCYLSDRNYKQLDFYTDLQPDRDFDIYTMNNQQRCEQPIVHGKENSECFWRVRSAQRLDTKVVRDSLTVKSIVECQVECLKAVRFTCRAFSFRYGSPVIGGAIDNCQLTDWPFFELDPRVHLVPEPGYELYERGSFGHGCEPDHFGIRGKPWKAPGTRVDQLCYIGFGKPARLLREATRKEVHVLSEEECKAECSKLRHSTLFQCMSFSYSNNAKWGPNCKLSDILQRDLLPDVDYVPDPDSWLFAWDNYNPECRAIVNDPIHNHIGPKDSGIRNRHDYDLFNALATWRVYSVSGWPCRRGTLCQENREAGFWFCELEGGDSHAWDYCCRPDHQCGYSQGFPYQWCYVGPVRTQWRKCSDRYYPYVHHYIDRFDHPRPPPRRPGGRPDRPPPPPARPPPRPSLDEYEAEFDMQFLDPPKPGGFGQPRHWPLSYLHKEMPPNNTDSEPRLMKSVKNPKFAAIQNLIDVIKSNDLKNIQYQITNESNKEDDILFVKIPLPTNFTQETMKRSEKMTTNTTLSVSGPVDLVAETNSTNRSQKSLTRSQLSLEKMAPVYRRGYVERTNVTNHKARSSKTL